MGIGMGRNGYLTTTAIICMAAATPALAQSKTFDVPAQSATTGIAALGRQADIQIVAARRDTRGKKTNAVRGNLTVDQALAQLLEGTGLIVRRTGQETYSVIPLGVQGERSAGGQPTSPEAGKIASPLRGSAAGGSIADNEGADIVVTGSRIRGARPSSPVIKITQQEMRNAGQNNLGEVIRSIPQNFAGGQNPGIVTGAEGTGNQNFNSGAQINLRGLGADATLTLLNGRRLPYDSAGQGVDISSIPAVAVDRLEIVADGASALYGSDAVGGVANIVLKRDFNGLATSVRLGGATDGGYFQQQYTAVAGGTWTSGGIMIAADLERSDEVTAGQRAITAALDPSATLLPYQKYYGGVVTAHQSLAQGLTLSIDSAYGNRRAHYEIPTTTTAPYTTTGTGRSTSLTTYYISPALRFTLPHAWAGEIFGSYGRDNSYSNSQSYSKGVPGTVALTQYTNNSKIVEINAEGPLFTLPGGATRLALGVGFRKNGLNSFRNGAAFTLGRDSRYAFAELNVPLVSASQHIAGIEQLSFTAAGRYEHYTSFSDVFTPKFGMIYSPTAAFDLKGSWGKSFKTPTLSLQYGSSTANLYQVTVLGGSGFPAGTTGISLSGANPDITPERSSNATFTLAIHPPGLDRFRFEVSYFTVDYTGRIIAPMTSVSTALSNALYATFVDRAPTQGKIDAAVASTTSGILTNLSGQPYDASKIVAIVDNRVHNVAKQAVHGFDFSFSYRFDTGTRGRLLSSASASYVKSTQVLLSGQPSAQVSGLIFNTPSFKARGGLTWTNEQLTFASYLNYTDGVDDNRYTPNPRVSSMTTVDFTARVKASNAGFLSGTELAISAINLFNVAPGRIQTAATYYAPYDSVNYSVLGRVVSVTISKRW